jgi:outer membrane protein insertion porin family
MFERPSLAGTCLFFALHLPAWAQDFPLLNVQVEGNARLPGPAIAAAGGLRSGQRATKGDFDNAAKALFDTGLFASASYHYVASPDGKGFLLTFQVQEAPAPVIVRLDIPGLREDDLWKELATSAPLVTRQMPENIQAEAYYKSALESVLVRLNHAQKIANRTEGSLAASGKMTSVFLPADLPKVGGIRFEGNRAFDQAALTKVLGPLAVGRSLTEHDFRELLDLNIKPLYEEKGFLTVKFSGVTFSNEAQPPVPLVSTIVEEGPVWMLGQVELNGDLPNRDQAKKKANFPEGKLANWKKIEESFGSIELDLTRQGYLGPQTRVTRTYHDDSKIVDLAAEVRPGKQFFFGQLLISGLDASARARAQKLWTLKPGDPMNAPYIDDYLREVGKALGNALHGISHGMRAGAAPDTIDVVVTMK